jgi:hypothetical protein
MNTSVKAVIVLPKRLNVVCMNPYHPTISGKGAVPSIENGCCHVRIKVRSVWASRSKGSYDKCTEALITEDQKGLLLNVMV